MWAELISGSLLKVFFFFKKTFFLFFPYIAIKAKDLKRFGRNICKCIMAESANGMNVSTLHDLNAGFPKKPEAKRGTKAQHLQTRGVDMLEECEDADSDGSVRACRSVMVLEWREV